MSKNASENSDSLPCSSATEQFFRDLRSAGGSAWDEVTDVDAELTLIRGGGGETAAIVQTLLDCYLHSQGDSQMVRCVARAAGLNPLSATDRQILRQTIGEIRLHEFESILKDQEGRE